MQNYNCLDLFKVLFENYIQNIVNEANRKSTNRKYGRTYQDTNIFYFCTFTKYNEKT